MEQERKRYKIVYADPPWDYKPWTRKGNGNVRDHYPTLPLEVLRTFDVPGICFEDCVLLMWATFPHLITALELGKYWGFEYKTVAFVWVKLYWNKQRPVMGMGRYTRANAEIVLLFAKGKPLKRIDNRVEQVVISRRGPHSQKPPEIRDRIVRLFGDLPRVELFARSRKGFFPDEEYKGWDVFGNEVNGSIDLQGGPVDG